LAQAVRQAQAVLIQYLAQLLALAVDTGLLIHPLRQEQMVVLGAVPEVLLVATLLAQETQMR
jgi:hypothetical protein